MYISSSFNLSHIDNFCYLTIFYNYNKENYTKDLNNLKIGKVKRSVQLRSTQSKSKKLGVTLCEKIKEQGHNRFFPKDGN